MTTHTKNGKVNTFFHVTLPRFLKNTFEVTHSKASTIVGSVFCLVTLTFIIISIGTYSVLPVNTRWLIMALDLALPFLLALSIIYTVRFKSEKARRISGFVILFLMPFALMTITECLNNVFVFKMRFLGVLGNYLVMLLAFFLFYALTGSFKVSYLIVNTVCFGLALAHCYIMSCRGTPFQPMDFFSITTAAGVANTYTFWPDYKIITASILFIMLTNIVIKMNTPKYTLPTKIISRAFTFSFTAILLILFYFTNIFGKLGVRPDFWNQTRGYNRTGFIFNFFANTRYMYVTTPENYDHTKIDQMVHEHQYVYPDIPSQQTPNIICIMNESLSDLSVLGDFEATAEYMPFLNSLTENTIRGNLYVPVIGAGTSNTEFEFLTGHTTAFLPTGSNAYMLYIKNTAPSLVSTLEAQGYSSSALHPYYANGWKRPEVYSHFGFDKFTALEEIISPTILQNFQDKGNDFEYLNDAVNQAYPGTNMLVRQYVSDAYNYDLLIKDFENRDKSKPYFMFNVTMQNHGGYGAEYSNFKNAIELVSPEGEYPKVDQYLSLVKRSDDAFKKLIKYFSKVDEPTIICMFGDHQPNVESDFVCELLGAKSLSHLTIEQVQQRHTTPFYIWANYDIEEQTIDAMSSNYLSSYLLKTAGLQMTDYNKYLLALYEELPVVNEVGYIDKEGSYYKWSDKSKYTEILRKSYEHIQHNCVHDKKNFKHDLFYFKDYVHKSSNLIREN